MILPTQQRIAMRRHFYLLLTFFFPAWLFSQTYNMTNGTFNTCSGSFYDSGGPSGNYGTNQNMTITFCSSTPGQQIYLQFTAFNIFSNLDYLYVYNGPNAASPLLGTYTGANSPGTVSSTNGCLTFVFTSNGLLTSTGWAATIGCGNPPAAPPTSTCATAQPFCTGSTITYPAGVNNGTAFSSPYDCLGSSPNPAWYYLEIDQPGNLDITMQSTPSYDIDFIMWGPFPSISVMCQQYALSNVIDCSYSTAAIEYANIVGAQTGQVYLLLITNFSNQNCQISFTQSGGAATTNCNILCNMTNLTAVPSACDPLTNTYSVSGQVNFIYPPASGTFDVSCNCGGTTVNIPSGISMTSPYNYTLNNIPAGAGACTISASFSADPTCNLSMVYNAPSGCNCGLTATGSMTEESCIGANDGTATVSVSGAIGNVVYSWTSAGGGSSNNLTGLSPGTYTCYVIDQGAANCTTLVTVTVSTTPDTQNPSILNCPTDFTIPNSLGNCGGNPTWTDPTTTDNCSAVIAQLQGPSPAGTALVPLGITQVLYQAQDLAGNTTNCSFNITIIDAEAPQFTFCPADISVSNDLGNCGAVVNWQSPLFTDNCLASASMVQSLGLAQGSLFPLGISTIQYIVTDGVGLTDTCSFTITVNDTEQPAFLNCPGNIVMALQSQCDTTVSWTAPTPTDNCPGVQMTSSHNPGASFPIGNTTVTYTATDAAGNTNTCSFTITVVAPAGLQATLTQLTPPACVGLTGTATVSANGGSGNYNYLWTTLPSQTTPTATLAAGNYIVTVTDALAGACVSLDTLHIQMNSPQALSISFSPTNPTCFGFADGSINAGVTGGTQPYAYTWNSSPAQYGPLASGLAAGTYTLNLVDNNGCTTSNSLTISQPDSLSASVMQTEVKCFGDATGAATITVNGGSQPYQYNWTNGVSSSATASSLMSGLYTVTVTDAQNCQLSRTFDILQPAAALTATTTTTSASCYGSKSGTASVSASGGVAPYSYLWNSSPGQITATASNLAANTYNVTVKDANNCVFTATATVGQPERLLVSIIDFQHPYCDSANGSITLGVSGGTQPYSYTWNSDPQLSSPTLSLAAAGTHQCVVTDAQNCRTTISKSLLNNPPAQALFTSTPEPTAEIFANSATVKFQNLSTGGYAYSWDFGDNLSSTAVNPTHTYYEEGTYTVILTAFNRYFVCPTTYSLTYIVLPNGDVFIPNAFSPNMDGANDVWEIVGRGVAELSCVLYDRWGKEIYALTSINDSWDGRDKSGKPLPEGVYTYKIKVVLNDNRVVYRGGTVTLLR